jgi:hypothetical protein
MKEKLNINTTTAPTSGEKIRKIGATTFIVSTSFNNERKRDIVSVISRLIDKDLTA